MVKPTVKSKYPVEFITSVSDQSGTLRSRLPAPLLTYLKAGHGDAIHLTLTGPDAIEVKVMRDRGYSGARPVERIRVPPPSKKKSEVPVVVKKGNGKGAVALTKKKTTATKKKVSSKKKASAPAKVKTKNAKKKVRYSVDSLKF